MSPSQRWGGEGRGGLWLVGGWQGAGAQPCVNKHGDQKSQLTHRGKANGAGSRNKHRPGPQPAAFIFTDCHLCRQGHRYLSASVSSPSLGMWGASERGWSLGSGGGVWGAEVEGWAWWRWLRGG